MSFLLDTNAVSEWVKPRPNPGLIAWMESADEDRIFLSVISLAELRYGVDRMANGKRKHRLHEWLLSELPGRFEDRMLPVDATIADCWGKIVALCELAGQPISVMDAFLAATAEVHKLTLVSRNVSDFRMVTKIISPWTEP